MSIYLPNVIAKPSGLDFLATGLSESIDIVKTWNIRVPDSSRLPLAVRLLQRTSKLSEYPPDTQELVRIGNAIGTGFDFYRITRFLPDERIPAIAEDLRRALGGSLDDTGPSSAFRAQSQISLAAILTAGGLKPGAPETTGASTPDYLVSIGTVTFGVEIKRPESVRSIQQRVDEAIDQIDTFSTSGGVLTFDVTDCVGSQFNPDARDNGASSKFEIVCETVQHAVENSTRPGLSKVTNLVVFGVWLRWEAGPPIVPRGTLLTYDKVFRSARHGLIFEQSKQVLNRIFHGMTALGGKILERVPA